MAFLATNCHDYSLASGAGLSIATNQELCRHSFPLLGANAGLKSVGDRAVTQEPGYFPALLGFFFLGLALRSCGRAFKMPRRARILPRCD
jgi:hypothetical protein